MSVPHPVDNPSGPTAGGTPPRGRRFWWVVGSAVLALLVTVLVVASVAASNRADPRAAGESTSALPSERPSALPGVSPSATPTVVPTTPAVAPPADAAPAPTEPAVDEPAPPAEQAPVALTESVAAAPGVVFSIGPLEAVDGAARGPGEVGGPALQFTVTVRNDTADTVSLASTVVNVYFGTLQSPATELSASGGAPFPQSVAAGATQQGVFVFTVPTDERDQVRIAVDYSVDVPIVLFEGTAPS